VVVPAQLFERASGGGRRPAVVYVHGGPPRQMLLGWHYSDYYANAYAVNQHLASRGFVVLIHADDDRNVRFAQTVDLARRLAARGASTRNSFSWTTRTTGCATPTRCA